MTEREELEAVIRPHLAKMCEAGFLNALRGTSADKPRKVMSPVIDEQARLSAKDILSSGYTKGNSELVETAGLLADAVFEELPVKCKAMTDLAEAVRKALPDSEASPGERIIAGLDEALAFAKSDSEGVAPSGRSGGDDWRPIETAQELSLLRGMATLNPGDSMKVTLNGQALTITATNGDHHDEG